MGLLIIFFLFFWYYRENYLFTCECPKCLSEADDPDMTSEEEEEMDEED